MILLQGNNLSRTFGADVLFENVNFSIKEKARAALVGKNGAGKSTLLKMIVTEEAPSSGEITTVKDLKIGYLAQQTELSSELTIIAELEGVFAELQQQEAELRELEGRMAEVSEEKLEVLMREYDQKSEDFRAKGGFTYQSDLRSMLNAFQFPEETWSDYISTLSGGQKTRLALAKMLLSSPDLLILDEPTNHLDIETLTWLENYLQSYRGALLLVSHDRYFLDRVAKEVYELSHGQLTHYSGNYSAYIEASELNQLTAARAYEKQQKEIADLEEFVAKNLVRASTTKRAQSRQKRLDKIVRLDAPSTASKTVNLTFRPEKASGSEVLQISNAEIGYKGEVLAKNINLEVHKLDAIAVVGPNGIGKTSLIKSALGKIPLLAGTTRLGTNVMVGYYDQNQENLIGSRTVLEELWHEHHLLPEVDIRNVLGAFLFSGDDVKKVVNILSGGEKSRLLLAKLAMEHDNFLVLDEPTNHLDIESREVLEQALIDFAGSLLFVSHDRYFINRIATKVFELTMEGGKLYLGDYDYYLEKKKETAKAQENKENKQSEEKATAKMDNRQEQKDKAREARKITREVAGLEEDIEKTDQKLADLQEKMTENSNDFSKLAEQQKELEKLSEKKEKLENRWLELQEGLE